MARIRVNYVFGKLGAALSTGDTTMSSAELARLPAVTGGDVAAVTLRDAVAGAHEIVHVTGHAAGATTATIARGQENTTARSWNAGVAWVHSPTALDFATEVAASGVTFTPVGQVAATDVQAAIAELDAEKAATGHTHTRSQVTDFAHTHTRSEVTDFAHTHTRSEVTDFAHTHGVADLTASGTRDATTFLRGDNTWAAAGGGPFKLNGTSDVIIPVDNADSFVVGSDRMDRDTAATAKDIRLFFNKAKAAFRSGVATGDSWDDANVGNYSTALGYNTKASGFASTAVGESTTASGSRAFASGLSSTSTAQHSVAFGEASSASANCSVAMGRNAAARGPVSIALGEDVSANSYNAVAIGAYSTAGTTNAVALGMQAEAQGVDSVAVGRGTYAGGSNSLATGGYSRADRHGQHAHSSSTVAGTKGDAQTSVMVLTRQTTDATASLLTASSTKTAALTGEGTNVLTLPASRAMRVVIDTVARRTDVQGEMAGFSWEGLVGRDSTGNARIIGTPTESKWNDTAAAAWALGVSVNTTDATNNYLAVTATGEAAKTIRWVAKVEFTEVG